MTGAELWEWSDRVDEAETAEQCDELHDLLERSVPDEEERADVHEMIEHRRQILINA